MRLSVAVLLANLLTQGMALSQSLTAGFEGYAVGLQGNALVGSSFIENGSGISLSDVLGPLGSGTFYVIRVNTAGPAPVLPGNYLVGGNTTFGPTSGAVFEMNFDFTASFPSLTDRLEMDLLYRTIAEDSSVTLNGFGPGGELLAQQVIALPAHNLPIGVQGNLTVLHATLVSSGLIQRVVVDSSANAQVGFDNISVPEPSALSLILGLLLLRRRFRPIAIWNSARTELPNISVNALHAPRN